MAVIKINTQQIKQATQAEETRVPKRLERAMGEPSGYVKGSGSSHVIYKADGKTVTLPYVSGDLTPDEVTEIDNELRLLGLAYERGKELGLSGTELRTYASNMVDAMILAFKEQSKD